MCLASRIQDHRFEPRPLGSVASAPDSGKTRLTADVAFFLMWLSYVAFLRLFQTVALVAFVWLVQTVAMVAVPFLKMR